VAEDGIADWRGPPRVADLIEQNGEELAQLETLDNGKSINESRNVDAAAAAGTFRYYAGG
jgi:acyl-CoA reductase-like NAD-dependent aldehyde dehydrogenase